MKPEFPSFPAAVTMIFPAGERVQHLVERERAFVGTFLRAPG